MPGVYGREIYLLIADPVLVGQGSLGDVTKNKSAGGHNFPSLPPSLDTQTIVETAQWVPTQQELSLPTLLTECPTLALFCESTPSIPVLARVFPGG